MTNTEDILFKLTNKIPLSVKDMKDIARTPTLQPEFIIGDLLIRQGKALLYGKPKRGKTNLALLIALLLSGGREFFGKQTIKQLVLYITTEQQAIALSDRISKMANTLVIDEGMLLYYLEGGERNINRIRELIEQHNPTFVVIDCLYNLIGETNDQKVITPWLNNFDILTKQYGISILVVHHRRKQGSKPTAGEQLDDITDEIMGSGFFGMWANLIIGMAKQDMTTDTVDVGFVSRDSKNGMDNLALFWNRDKCIFDIVESLPEVDRPNLDVIYRKEIVSWLKQNIENYNTTSRLVEAARDNFEGRRGWKGLNKYWDCWNVAKNEIDFDDWIKTHPGVVNGEKDVRVL